MTKHNQPSQYFFTLPISLVVKVLRPYCLQQPYVQTHGPLYVEGEWGEILPGVWTKYVLLEQSSSKPPCCTVLGT